MPIAEDGHSSERGSEAIQPGEMGGNPGLSAGSELSQGASRKRYYLGKIERKLITLYKSEKQRKIRSKDLCPGARCGTFPGSPAPRARRRRAPTCAWAARGWGGRGARQGPCSPVPSVSSCPPFPQDSSDRCYLHQGVYYHRLLHNCILTLLNGSAELFKHPSLPPANNSLGKKEKKCGSGGAAKELPIALAPSFCSVSLGTSGSTLSTLDPILCTRVQGNREDLQ